MKSTLYYLPVMALISLFSSCASVGFKRPQPINIAKNERRFPSAWEGYYLQAGDKSDTLQIKGKTIHSIKDTKADDDIVLSDSVILRKDDNNYFLNIRDRAVGLWLVVLIRTDGNNLSEYFLAPEDSMIKALKAITPVIEVNDSSQQFSEQAHYFSPHHYEIDPKPAQLTTILQQNLFVLQGTYKRIKLSRAK